MSSNYTVPKVQTGLKEGPSHSSVTNGLAGLTSHLLLTTRSSAAEARELLPPQTQEVTHAQRKRKQEERAAPPVRDHPSAHSVPTTAEGTEVSDNRWPAAAGLTPGQPHAAQTI